MKKILVVLFFLLSVSILVGCKKDYKGDYVVINDISGQIIKGKDSMDSFYERTKKGEKLRLVYIEKYKEDGVEKSETSYIEYDGNYYITNYQLYANSSKIIKYKYKYLVYSCEEGMVGSNIEKYEYYCLSNNENHTYQVVMNSWFSSILEEHIDGIPFYCYEQYKEDFKLGNYSSNLSFTSGSMLRPTITFLNSHEYGFIYNMYASAIDFGKYEIVDGYVYLISNKTNSIEEEQQMRLAFKIKNNKLIFDLKMSNVDDFNLKDGTVFYYIDEYCDDVKYKVNVIDNHGILIEPLDDEYKPGDIVRVKLRFFSGIRAGIKVNDELIEVSTDGVLWEYEIYEFIMPSEDVTLYTTINGSINYTNQ